MADQEEPMDKNIWQSDRDYLEREMDAQITKRAIKKIVFPHDGKVLVAEVGKPGPHSDNKGIVRAIYEDIHRKCFLIVAGGTVVSAKSTLVEEA
jgi:hypothetical protein